MLKIITKNDQDTFNFGLKLGKNCQGGEVFALCGDLGAGKTKLAQGLARGLGVEERVTSPTFNILKTYLVSGSERIFCHIDAYRLRSAQDLVSLGIEELFASQQAVIVIEWADKVKKIWPLKARQIKIRALSEQRREIIYYGRI
ncbi:MAG: tRNA (adenosine(37)-N6)-threonylcarbamoyltransferase complex ATPase subunit type 1 TsaE [Patescibacteria group bacterium]